MDVTVVPEFGLSVPVVLAIVAFIRKGVPKTVPTWVWTWVALAVSLATAAVCKSLGILTVGWGHAMVNGLMVGLVATNVYDGVVSAVRGK